ncbi:MAG: RecQ family ATP-dependent DNA helicase [archaeon]|nr:RecQ family ATP-dependent DNA helicase [archaeon]
MNDIKMNVNGSKDPLTILTTVFNHRSFRSNQEDIIDNVLAGRNTLAILPTGAGKSLCFQIPALIFDGLTVVISPLIALMKDQVDNLKKKGVLDVAYINSMLEQRTKERIYEQLKESKLKILYVAPETFVDNKLMSILKGCNISLIAIDEVHCISIWGHNFRPDYLRLRSVIKALNNPPPPVLGLTATATKTVEEDIQTQLGIECDVFKDSFNRKNLLFSVLTLKSNIRKEEFLKGLLEKLKGSAIVYVNFTRTAEELAEYLAGEGLSASHYHGQIKDKEERRRIQNDFISGRTRIVVATNAFGMGIDKEDIRTIIHYNLPKSIENYYQEVGRAGRDQNISNCILLYSEEDGIKLRKLIKRNTPSTKQIKAVLDLLTRGVGKLIYVNVKRIANDLKLDEVPVRLMLHHLERMGAIKTYFRIYRRAVVRMQNADVKSLKYQQEAEKIIRDAYFKKNLNNWMDLEVLSSSVQISIPRINNVLRELKIGGIIELEERDFCTPIKVNPGIKDVDIIVLLEIFFQLEESGMKKIDTVVEYVEREECKRKFILNYFGEDHSGECSACSVCNPLLLRNIGAGIEVGELASVSSKDIERFKKSKTEEKFNARVKEIQNLKADILTILKTINKPAYKSNIARLLTGSPKAETLCERYKLHDYFGRYANFTQKEVRKEIVRLVESGYLSKTGEGKKAYPVVLAGGERGKQELESHSSPWVLGEAKDAKNIPELIEFTKSENGNERRLAASALGKLSVFKPQIFKAVPHLIKLLDDEKPQVRQYAAKALGKIGSEDATPHLKRLLNDEMPYVREAATAALKRTKVGVEEKSMKAEEELFEKLKRLRGDIWREDNLHPSMFPASTLREIAAKMPTTKEELMLIKWIGPEKVEKYGERILSVIRAHLSEKSKA